MGKSIKGTKTEQNLREAFAGESQARNKYDLFADIAEEERQMAEPAAGHDSDRSCSVGGVRQHPVLLLHDQRGAVADRRGGRLMRFAEPLVEGRLVRRYQRFLADVDTAAGRVTAHCPNTGSMLGCAEPGMRVWLSPASNPARKLAWTWELVEALPGVVVGMHTGRSNGLVREAIEAGRVAELAGYAVIRPEVKYGAGSRIDFLLQGPGRPDCYLEVKNVTAAVEGGVGWFPDAVTTRGARHLREMAAMVAAGHRAVLVITGKGKVGQGVIVRRLGNWERGVFAVGDGEPRLPDRGLAIRVATPRIDADAWKNYLPEGSNGGADAGGLALNVVSLKTPLLRVFERDFSNVDLTLRPRDSGWQIGLNTREAVGDIFWKSAGEGWVEGNFKRLVVRPAAEIGEGSTTLINTLPGMSLSVDDLHIGDKALGKLELKARNDKGAWNLDTLSLQNPDGALKGKGVWNNTGRHQTRLDFELTAKDVGKLLDRLGFVDTVRRGTARLTGDLQWSGPLTGLHYPSLSGQLTVAAEKGQFNKLEPGVGKLLGLISLQSLPRRLTLDFRDIFSDGLAFDSIEGKLAIRKGVMRTTDPLRIFGPAAQIEMQGETDLKNETQDLQVVVRPEIGSAAAVGVAIVNPVVGAATLLANTVLQKPLNRLFSYRYHVTGTWADPKIDKAGEAPPEVKPSVEEDNKP